MRLNSSAYSVRSIVGLIFVLMGSATLAFADETGPHGGELFHYDDHTLEWIEQEGVVHIYDLTPEKPALSPLLELKSFPFLKKQNKKEIEFFFRDIDGTLPRYMTQQSGSQINTFFPQSATGFKIRLK